MKTIILAACVAVTTLAATAAPKKQAVVVTLKSQKAFEAEFGNVANVSWSSARNNMLRATFKEDEETVHAFFSNAGEYVCSTVARSANELPKKLLANIAAKYPAHQVLEAFVLRTPEGESIYVKIQTEDSAVLLKGNNAGYFTQVTEKNPY
jgi:hypothetical protein